ncbi:MAG: hypothetical protein ABI359_07225 [Ginsengibacter sp.]
MKLRSGIAILIILLSSCAAKNDNSQSTKKNLPISGTWKLFSATIVEKGDTTKTDYTKNTSFIKIINDTHFAFLTHGLEKGKDSTNNFDAGGGSYSLVDSNYTEHLEYCKEPEWEGHDFAFVVTIKNDTLIQKGIEKVDNAGINRLNIERYVRLKN